MCQCASGVPGEMAACAPASPLPTCPVPSARLTAGLSKEGPPVRVLLDATLLYVRSCVTEFVFGGWLRWLS